VWQGEVDGTSRSTLAAPKAVAISGRFPRHCPVRLTNPVGWPQSCFNVGQTTGDAGPSSKDTVFSPSFVANGVGTCWKQASSDYPACERIALNSYFYSYFVSFRKVKFNETNDFIGCF
jgi:hypothetical protein